MINQKFKKIITSKWILISTIFIIVLGIYANVKLTFKGKTQYITFRSDIDIEGVLIRPNTPGPYPAILLLHGAGGSHQEYNKLTFKMHANAFLKKGFAVMVYTKRGSGKNNVDYKYFTYEDLKNDAKAALSFLRNKDDIDGSKIGLMGVSESGWFTPEIALEDSNIKFIVNKVSSPLNVRETVIHERKQDALAEGFTKQEVENEILPLTKRIWQFYIDVANNPSLANGNDRDKINQELSKMNKHDRLGKWFTYDKLNDYDARLYASRGQNYLYDPMPFIEKIEVPMLYVMGGKDKNMPTNQIVEILERLRNDNQKDISVKVYPNASHYLNKWGLEDGPHTGWLYVEGYLDLISNWAAEQVE